MGPERRRILVGHNQVGRSQAQPEGIQVQAEDSQQQVEDSQVQAEHSPVVVDTHIVVVVEVVLLHMAEEELKGNKLV